MVLEKECQLQTEEGFLQQDAPKEEKNSLYPTNFKLMINNRLTVSFFCIDY